MKWNRGQRSSNLEDMRGATGGGGGGFRGGGARLGLGGMVVLLVLSLVFKKDFFSLVGGGGGTASTEQPTGPVQSTPQEEEQVDFVSAVLDSTQVFWNGAMPQLGGRYQNADLVLFRDAIQSACGFAEAATGPFYCPGDQKVYIDLGFYDELRQRFGAPGDFAQAYVLAHEIGHHVQNLLGTERKLRQLQQSRPDEANALSVRMELQADCYAGVWAHSYQAQGGLEAGDIEEGLGAAASVGDDRIQRMGGGRVNPEGFTHGSAEQRSRWFTTGFRSGDPRQCDTFNASSLEVRGER
jgi:predicted metalloprotease